MLALRGREAKVSGVPRSRAIYSSDDDDDGDGDDGVDGQRCGDDADRDHTRDSFVDVHTYLASC